jgi:hypothetical protein
MKTKNLLILILIVESALVLVTLLLGKNAWVGIVCYWAVLLMKNILDYIDEKRKKP